MYLLFELSQTMHTEGAQQCHFVKLCLSVVVITGHAQPHCCSVDDVVQPGSNGNSSKIG